MGESVWYGPCETFGMLPYGHVRDDGIPVFASRYSGYLQSILNRYGGISGGLVRVMIISGEG
jgi:hypothetical protein